MNGHNSMVDQTVSPQTPPPQIPPWHTSPAQPEQAGQDRLRSAGERIPTLIDALGAGGAVARERAEELVRQVTDLYGTGLERILNLLADRGVLDDGMLDALIADELISSLLLVHGLHPQDVATRVAAALERVRPYLGSHGGDVELLDISSEGVVRLRLLGSCDGCPSSAVTLKFAVEDAIETAAPEVTAIQVEEAAHAASPTLIPVASLRIRLADSPDDSSGGDRWADVGAGSWEPIPELADLQPGEVAGFEAGGQPVLVCHTGKDMFAFRDYCPRCLGSLAGASLQRALAAPVGGGVLRCPTCHSHFDVRGAGICNEDENLHLDPLPLLVRSGVPSVAVPTIAEPVG